MRIWFVVAVVVALGGCRPSTEACGRLLDHFVDVEARADVAGHFRQLTPPLVDAVEREKRAFRAQLAERFVARCQEQLSSSELRCALAADDEAGLDRCEHR